LLVPLTARVRERGHTHPGQGLRMSSEEAAQLALVVVTEDAEVMSAGEPVSLERRLPEGSREALGLWLKCLPVAVFIQVVPVRIFFGSSALYGPAHLCGSHLCHSIPPAVLDSILGYFLWSGTTIVLVMAGYRWLAALPMVTSVVWPLVFILAFYPINFGLREDVIIIGRALLPLALWTGPVLLVLRRWPHPPRDRDPLSPIYRKATGIACVLLLVVCVISPLSGIVSAVLPAFVFAVLLGTERPWWPWACVLMPALIAIGFAVGISIARSSFGWFLAGAGVAFGITLVASFMGSAVRPLIRRIWSRGTRGLPQPLDAA